MAFSARGVLNALDWAEKKKQYEDELERVERIRKEDIERADRIRTEDLVSRREDILLDYFTKSGGTAGGVNTKDLTKASTDAYKLQQRLKNEDITDPEIKNFYDNLFKDPLAAAEAFSFIKEQEEKFGQVIKLKDLPTYINIVNTPNATVGEKIDLFKEFELVDLSNKEDYYKLASRIKGMTGKTGRTVLTDPKPGFNVNQQDAIKLAEAQYAAMLDLIEPTAKAWLSANPDSADPKAVDTANALKNLTNNDELVKSAARRYLFETYTDKGFVSSLEKTAPSEFRGLSKVPQVKLLLEMKEAEAAKEAAEKATEEEAKQKEVVQEEEVELIVTQKMVDMKPSLKPYLGSTLLFKKGKENKLIPIIPN